MGEGRGGDVVREFVGVSPPPLPSGTTHTHPSQGPSLSQYFCCYTPSLPHTPRARQTSFHASSPAPARIRTVATKLHPSALPIPAFSTPLRKHVYTGYDAKGVAGHDQRHLSYWSARGLSSWAPGCPGTDAALADQDCRDELQGRRTAGLGVFARKELRGSVRTEEGDAGGCT